MDNREIMKIQGLLKEHRKTRGYSTGFSSLLMYEKSNEVVKVFYNFTGSSGTVFHGLWFGSVCHIVYLGSRNMSSIGHVSMSETLIFTGCSYKSIYRTGIFTRSSR